MKSEKKLVNVGALFEFLVVWGIAPVGVSERPRSTLPITSREGLGGGEGWFLADSVARIKFEIVRFRLLRFCSTLEYQDNFIGVFENEPFLSS